MVTQVKVALPPINVPVTDVKTGMMDPQWYRWFETMQKRTGGDVDKVALNENTLTLKANKDVTIEIGNGLEGGGALENDVHISAKQDIGWTAATGVGDKGAYIEYPGQTISVSYTQAEIQAIDDGLRDASARLLAIEEALRANGAIDG